MSLIAESSDDVVVGRRPSAWRISQKLVGQELTLYEGTPKTDLRIPLGDR